VVPSQTNKETEQRQRKEWFAGSIKYKLLDDDCKHKLHKQIHKNGMKSSKEIVGYSKNTLHHVLR
jgi:hypothetical protein